jgi:hypothetical protein
MHTFHAGQWVPIQVKSSHGSRRYYDPKKVVVIRMDDHLSAVEVVKGQRIATLPGTLFDRTNNGDTSAQRHLDEMGEALRWKLDTSEFIGRNRKNTSGK